MDIQEQHDGVPKVPRVVGWAAIGRPNTIDLD